MWRFDGIGWYISSPASPSRAGPPFETRRFSLCSCTRPSSRLWSVRDASSGLRIARLPSRFQNFSGRRRRRCTCSTVDPAVPRLKELAMEDPPNHDPVDPLFYTFSPHQPDTTHLRHLSIDFAEALHGTEESFVDKLRQVRRRTCRLESARASRSRLWLRFSGRGGDLLPSFSCVASHRATRRHGKKRCEDRRVEDKRARGS